MNSTIRPNAGQQVTVHYIGKLKNGKVFDESNETPYQFVLGSDKVIAGWNEEVEKMTVGEKKTFTCAPDKAYGSQGKPPTIPPNSTLNFEVELLDVREKPAEKWDMNDEERREFITECELKGYFFSNQNRHDVAVLFYRDAHTYASFLEKRDTSLIVKMGNNLSFNLLKMDRFIECKDMAESILIIEPTNQKAILRLGLAQMGLCYFDSAMNTFKELNDTDTVEKCQRKVRFAIKKVEEERAAKELEKLVVDVPKRRYFLKTESFNRKNMMIGSAVVGGFLLVAYGVKKIF